MLEEVNKIDMIIAGTVLVITDAGITRDINERRELLRKKLHSYTVALTNGQLADHIPDPRSAVIEVMCADPPEETYQGIDSVEVNPPNGPPSFVVPVTFTHQPNPYA